MTRLLTVAAVCALLVACADGRDQPPAPVIYQGSQPATTAAQPAPSGAPSQAPAPATSSSEAAAPAAEPVQAAAQPAAGTTDGRGVTFYEGYQTITARQGDTVESMAQRVGINGAELAAYNGLSTLYSPLPGDELVLPARQGGYTTQIASAPAAPNPGSTTAGTDPAPQSTGWSPALVNAAIEDASAAEPQPVEATEAEPTPAAEPAPEPELQTAALDEAVAAPTLEPTTGSTADSDPNDGVVLTTTTQAPEPATATPAPAPTPTQTETVAASATPGVFVRPVDAPISRPFSKRAGPSRNDGVDFASPAGMEVKAADAGTVVLVSKSLGGLGTIVLIRHQNEFLTVYGRIDEVTVAKGDNVARGQVIAKVAALSAPRTPSLHFEIRRGPESIDPESFI